LLLDRALQSFVAETPWSHIVIVFASPALLLSLCAMALNPVAVTARVTACYQLPANIHANDALKAAIVPLLARSQTLRAQCTKIAASGRTQVTLALTTARLTARARSTARRYASGLLIVDIEIPPARQDFAELLAHELEHATEFIDRVNFKALARVHGGQVVETGADGGFESQRAQKAGRAAAAEIEAPVDPAVVAVGRDIVRAARALGLR
jgi:hypothetical protein